MDFLFKPYPGDALFLVLKPCLAAPLTEIYNLKGEFWEFSIHVEAVKWYKGRTYGILTNNEKISSALEVPESENE